jgi:N-methylhydantoinase A
MNRTDQYFLGGEQQLNADRANETIEREVAEPLGVSTAEAALRIRQRVDQNIANSIEGQLAAHNVNPEEASLIAYGGAGPAHCCSFAQKAGIKQIITAPAAAEFSAFGGATLDVEHRYAETYGTTVPADTLEVDTNRYNETAEELEAEAVQDMAGEGFDADDIVFDFRLMVSAGEEVHEVSTPSRIEGGDDLESVLEPLDADAGTETDLETMVLTAIGPVETEELATHDLGSEDPSAAHKGTRQAYWLDDGWEESTVYQREDLEPGNVVDGRALIEAKDTTYVVTDEWTYRIDEYGNGIIER